MVFVRAYALTILVELLTCISSFDNVCMVHYDVLHILILLSIQLIVLKSVFDWLFVVINF